MKIQELRALSSDDLVHKEKTLKKELFDLNFQRQTGTVEKPARFKNIKRDIARILTILQERETTNERNTAKR
jgi:large subunit ribosomal protein L29